MKTTKITTKQFKQLVQAMIKKEIAGKKLKVRAYDEKLAEKLFKKLVPAEGEATTTEGELLRIVNDTIYQINNNGGAALDYNNVSESLEEGEELASKLNLKITKEFFKELIEKTEELVNFGEQSSEIDRIGDAEELAEFMRERGDRWSAEDLMTEIKDAEEYKPDDDEDYDAEKEIDDIIDNRIKGYREEVEKDHESAAKEIEEFANEAKIDEVMGEVLGYLAQVTSYKYKFKKFLGDKYESFINTLPKISIKVEKRK